MNKKFFKTYYGIPDKQNRIDVGFERGYRNIVVRFNGKEVASFATAAEILKTREITTPDNRLIHLKFLKESTDFEVFLDGIQIDNSETSPKKVIGHLKTPIYISMTWYIIVLLFSFYYGIHLYKYIARDVTILFTDISIIYLITSTYLVVIAMLVSLVWLNKGSSLLYLVAFGIVAGDMAFGAVYQFTILFLVNPDFVFLNLLALAIPLLFKLVAVSSFTRNWKKFKQFSHEKALTRQKTNPDLVDIE
jgi:hypothetical protein